MRKQLRSLHLAALLGLIFVRNMRGQYGEAESMAYAAIGTANKYFGVPRSTFTSLHCALGKSLNGQGRYAAQAWTEHFGDQHPKTIDALDALAQISERQGEAR
jgi:hypothetical protein